MTKLTFSIFCCLIVSVRHSEVFKLRSHHKTLEQFFFIIKRSARFGPILAILAPNYWNAFSKLAKADSIGFIASQNLLHDFR